MNARGFAAIGLHRPKDPANFGGVMRAAVLSWCRDVIYVPTAHCMNLAATVNVVLYDRQAKQLRDAKPLRRVA